MFSRLRPKLWLSIAMLAITAAGASAEESWPQFKYDGRHSGNVAERSVKTPLGLVGAVPLTDAIFTAPVVSQGRIYAVDGAGVATCIDAKTLEIVWRFRPRGGVNCNNVSSPAIVGDYLHYGTMAGSYYVLDLAGGRLVKEIACGEPIFSTPVVGNGRAYFATLGAQVYAAEPAGTVAWTWDYVRQVLGFTGDRFSGEDWRKHKQGRVTWRDHFFCSRDIALFDRTLVIPAGGATLWLEDAGSSAEQRGVGLVPNLAGNEYPATFGQSIGEDGAVYRQWHRRDNYGRVEIMRLKDGKVETSFVPGTDTAVNQPGALSFSSVSLRGDDVFRCRPEEGMGLCRHSLADKKTMPLGGRSAASIASPVLLRNQVVYGGLNGELYVVPFDETSPAWSFRTAFGKAISAPPAVCDGRIYFGCEDGYLYILGPQGRAPLPAKSLELEKIRSPLTGPYADPKYDWFTNYGNMANTNSNDQGIKPPLKLNWIRRYEGTFKHLPVCGGGRSYTHTAEGQIFAVEQETGRLLWRRYWPGVHLSFTSPLYSNERLLVPQAGLKQSMIRCLNAATGDLLWEVRFTGAPSWSRQAPPIVHKNLAIYASGSGEYAPQGSDKAFLMTGQPAKTPEGAEVMSWLYSHNNPYYPRDNKPLIWAWDLETGREVWKRDFSALGTGGNDCGLCLLDGTIYYSTFFGYSASQRKRRGLPADVNGLTAALDPATGKTLWQTTDYYVTAGCTISARDGRLYVGGYNAPNEDTKDRNVLCLDAKDGLLVWKSDSVPSAVNVVTVADKFIFSNAYGRDGHVFDKETGKIISRFNNNYACTRFTVSGSYLMGANMDMIDLAGGNVLASTGPSIDSRECVGASVSNGRVFYTSQASGLQVSQRAGIEAVGFSAPWERKNK